MKALRLSVLMPRHNTFYERLARGFQEANLLFSEHGLTAYINHIDVLAPNGMVRQYSLCNPPGERQRYIKSATTDQWGNVRMTIDRSYPKGTTVALVALPQGQWGLGRSSTRRK